MLESSSAIEDLLRDVAPQVLGAVVRRCRDFDAADDAVQEALIAAAEQWPVEGIPASPKGWLIQVAVRRLANAWRSEVARRRREDVAAGQEPPFAAPADAEPTDADDTLTLLFLCCHPVLTATSAIALTLRAVGGLTTGQIASAFLVPEATMAQRISRAKQKIKSSGAPFTMPTAADRRSRVESVLRVLYLIFNEGYTSASGPTLQRTELAQEAIRLTREVHRLLPDDPEVAGLLALMILTNARRAARTGDHGEAIPLDRQDRGRWDRKDIEEGTALISATLRQAAVGPYQIQAAVAALHDEADRAEETDWPQILALYGLLERISPNPMVTLNRAVALAMVDGPEAGLALLSTVDHQLPGHYRIAAVRGHLSEMAGDRESAIAQFRLAATGTSSLAEYRYLMTHLASLKP